MDQHTGLHDFDFFSRLMDDVILRWTGLGWLSPTLFTPDNLGAQTRNTAFGKALLTLPVRSATVEFGLVGWRIEGRDLIFERGCSTPFTANEVVQTAVYLAKLARTFPADLADRFGTPPSTDIPLRGKDGITRNLKKRG